VGRTGSQNYWKLSVNSAIELVNTAKAIVFDFDGTLVDSNEIKWSGFEHVFAEYVEQLPEISAYCRGNNHTIRGEKFRYVCEQILHIDYTAEREKSLHERYAAYTTDGVAQAPEIPGAADFVRQVSDRPTALLSSTPHSIILEILQRKGWQSMFEVVQGAPVVKRDWLKRYQEKLGCAATDILFFGDTEEDEISAREAGCRFLRVGVTIKDFTSLS
jgi:beta-phosphoglucomutase-like phosphatase (HAD superfamily)